MKINVSELIANKANARKSTGPLSEDGKLRSAAKAKRYGLNTSLMSNESGLGEKLSLLVADAVRLGYSKQGAHALVAALKLVRAVIEAKY